MNARLAEQLAALRLAAHQAVEDAVEAEIDNQQSHDESAIKRSIEAEGELAALISARARVITSIGSFHKYSPTDACSIFSGHGTGALGRYERALGELRAERKLAAAQVARATAKRKAKPRYTTLPHEPKEFTDG